MNSRASEAAGPPARAAVLLISDVHAHFHVIEAQIAHALDDLGCPVSEVVVLGDFGCFGTDLHGFFRRDGCRFRRPVSFIEGNHEDFAALETLVREFADVVTYLPRATVRQCGGWRALCLGGARYMDAWSTPRGCEIRSEDIMACLAHSPGSVDVVLTHDCPTGIGVGHDNGLEHYGTPGVDALARLAAGLRPRLWFFGHHHRWHQCRLGETTYHGLPASWHGFALLHGDGRVVCVDHEVPLSPRPRWYRLFGLR